MERRSRARTGQVPHRTFILEVTSAVAQKTLHGETETGMQDELHGSLTGSVL
jgi:hypothetical protein